MNASRYAQPAGRAGEGALANRSACALSTGVLVAMDVLSPAARYRGSARSSSAFVMRERPLMPRSRASL